MIRNLLLLLVFLGILWFDYSKLKKHGKSVRIVYGSLMIVAAYLGLSYVLHANWPNIDGLVNLLVLQPARRIADYLSVPK